MDRSVEPQLKTLEGPSYIEGQELKAKNGIPLHFIVGETGGACTLEFNFYAGKKYQSHPWLASITSKMLLEGSASKTGTEIGDQIDFLGGYYSIQAGKDATLLSFSFLKEKLQKMLPIIRNILLYPNFEENSINKCKETAIQEFKINMDKVGYLARRKFDFIFFKDHPYGSLSGLEDMKAIDKYLLMDYYQHYLSPSNMECFATGNFDDSDLALVKHFLSDLPFVFRSKQQKMTFQAPVGLVEKVYHEKAVQTGVRMAWEGVMPQKEDAIKLNFALTVLGGYFGSRLMSNIREDKGYTYGIGSYAAGLEDSNYAFISTEVGSDVTEDAIHEIEKEIRLLQTEPMSNEELSLVKNYKMGRLLQGADGLFAMMDIYKSLKVSGLDYKWIETVPEAYQNITSEEVMETARKYLDLDKKVLVLAGSEKAISKI